jgi:hypothetical protein
VSGRSAVLDVDRAAAHHAKRVSACDRMERRSRGDAECMADSRRVHAPTRDARDSVKRADVVLRRAGDHALLIGDN